MDIGAVVRDIICYCTGVSDSAKIISIKISGHLVQNRLGVMMVS